MTDEKYMFSGWWGDGDEKTVPEPWETFRVTLHGEEAGDTADTPELVDQVLRASGKRLILCSDTDPEQHLLEAELIHLISVRKYMQKMMEWEKSELAKVKKSLAIMQTLYDENASSLAVRQKQIANIDDNIDRLKKKQCSTAASSSTFAGVTITTKPIGGNHDR